MFAASFKTILLVLLIAALVVCCINFFCLAKNHARKAMYWESMYNNSERKCNAYKEYYKKNERMLDALSMKYRNKVFDFNDFMKTKHGNAYMQAKHTLDSICYQSNLEEQ